MAERRAHFGEEPVERQEPLDLEATNEKLEEEKSEGVGSESDEAAHDASGNAAKLDKLGSNDKYEITEDDCYDELGYSFPAWKKWYILTVIFIVQVSMNFNTSLYSNALGGISSEFGVSEQAARVGAAIFLITYAFGCELWVCRHVLHAGERR